MSHEINICHCHSLRSIVLPETIPGCSAKRQSESQRQKECLRCYHSNSAVSDVYSVIYIIIYKRIFHVQKISNAHLSSAVVAATARRTPFCTTICVYTSIRVYVREFHVKIWMAPPYKYIGAVDRQQNSLHLFKCIRI